MASPTLTYTLSNGSTADATQVMQNLNDLLNGITDGTKDLSISALTCAGTVTLNGAVTLGNATGDDITVTGYVASNVLPKTNAAYDLGSSAQNWQALYLDDGATTGGTIYFDAGTTKYLQSSADGATATFGGFTTVSLGVLNTTANPTGKMISGSYTATVVSVTGFTIASASQDVLYMRVGANIIIHGAISFTGWTQSATNTISVTFPSGLGPSTDGNVVGPATLTDDSVLDQQGGRCTINDTTKFNVQFFKLPASGSGSGVIHFTCQYDTSA